jgi:hypothetical protein
MPSDSMGEPAGRWADNARGTIAGPSDTPTIAVCSDRYCSVPAALRSVSAGVARAGLPYFKFTVWPQTPASGERP